MFGSKRRSTAPAPGVCFAGSVQAGGAEIEGGDEQEVGTLSVVFICVHRKGGNSFVSARNDGNVFPLWVPKNTEDSAPVGTAAMCQVQRLNLIQTRHGMSPGTGGWCFVYGVRRV